MDFYTVLDQVVDLLRHRKRVTYRALQRQFNLDEAFLSDLKAELIEAQHLAADEEGNVLVWTGETEATAASGTPQTEPQFVSQPAQTMSDAPASLARPAPEAERRQLTVMFCDLVDSTVLSGQLDPEDLREVVRAYQAACAAVIQRFDGHIAQYLGDGLLVYFGYPQAHEDDAQRAVRTGLGIIAALGPLNAGLESAHGVRLAVRVGVHTGLVVVGEVGSGEHQERLALGETPNVAARLQGLAAPDTVLMSAATARLVQGYFTVHELGTQSLRGVTMPVQLYQVLRESGVQHRLDIATPRGLTPLVGREHEVGLLYERWRQVKDGLGQVVLLSGEAGVGKSRLVQSLTEHVAGEASARLECRCAPYSQHSALAPLIAHLQRVLAWRDEDTPEEKLRRLEEALVPSTLPLSEVVPLFAALLSLPPPAQYPSLTLPPERQRQKTLEALLAWLLAETERQPVLLIVEDLHWVDPSTLEWLSLVVEQSPTVPLLSLCTCRPEFVPPWSPRAHLTSLTLSRLPRPQVEQMVHSVTGGKPLPAEVLAQVVAKTDGVPLFVEELTKTVLESGLLREMDGVYKLTGPLPPLAIPATLQDALMARLDRLAAVKAVAQLGATIGRQFDYALLQAVASLDAVTLQQGLRQLVEAELLYQRGVPPQATYLFKHALIQDAAYQSLLKSTRQQYHQRIAQVLEAQFPDTAATQPELLAQHYTAAGLNEPAVSFWHQAGQHALERSAHLEAISHLSKGLEVLQTLPDTPERTRQELLVQTTLGPALMAVKGYAAREVEYAYARARELCQQVGDTPQFFPVLRGLWYFYLLRVELQTARELGEQFLSLAQRAHDPALLLEAHHILGNTLNYLGEFAAARAHLEQGITLYDRQQHRRHALLYGQDPGVACLSYAAQTLWLLGAPDQALQRCHEALTLAQEVAHPLSLTYALGFAAFLHIFRREWPLGQARAEAAITLAAEQGFAHWWALGTILQGCARVMQGQDEEGIAQIHQGLAALQATGTRGGWPYYLALLADAYGHSGHAEEGLRVLAEALEMVQHTGERRHEAELYRLQGELLLARSTAHATEAAVCFRRALDVARVQQAKSWELRAAMSLARLWQRQGKRAEAYQLLSEVYDWFAEGFDTADLQEARALLEELG